MRSVNGKRRTLLEDPFMANREVENIDSARDDEMTALYAGFEISGDNANVNNFIAEFKDIIQTLSAKHGVRVARNRLQTHPEV